jgi:YD repeat-containing protein
VTREGATSTFNYVFNKDNSITNMTGEEGYELTNSYTDSSHPHLPTAVKSNSSDVEDIKYDDRGNITSVTVKSLDGSKSRKVTMTYSTTNDLLSTTDAMGNTTNFTYDDRGNLVKVEQPEGVTSTMEVNAKGLVTKTTDPMGIVTQYEYNGYGNVTKILLTALNLQTRLEYDLASRITAAYDPLDRKASYTYDNNDNLLTEVDPLNNTTKYGYDKNDNLTTVTNAKGNTTTMTYDNATDWLLSVTFGSSSEK